MSKTSLRAMFRGLPEAKAKAAQVLPAGERFLGNQVVWPGQRLPKPRKWRRPRVLRGLRMPGDRWEGVKEFLWSILDNPVDGVFDRLFDWERKKGKPLKGGWSSLAGHLAVALHPRSKTTGVLQVLQLTEGRLQVMYVQHGRRKGDVGVVEPGWSTDVRQVAWLRDRSDVKADTHEIGFVDGSWVRVYFTGPDMKSFLACFPYRLRHTDPVPLRSS